MAMAFLFSFKQPETTTMMARYASVAALLLLLLALSAGVAVSGSSRDGILKLPSQVDDFFRPNASHDAGDDDSVGTRWAVLIAGSKGFSNYRHQADVCHAYQIMRRGGLKDENIVVFMYDDIAYSVWNPRPGIIINNPRGEDVYKGVPKDYTGDEVNAKNFLAAILGNRSAITGGSGKVVDSGPNDHVFIYYTDHGYPGVIGMPSKPYLYADDLIETLKKKHASGTYKSLVIYLEACEAGSMFEGLLPEGLNVFANTAANAEESSWAFYCPGQAYTAPPDFYTCLGDLYSISWMEDSEAHNLRTETLKQQYHVVYKRNFEISSCHAMLYGDLNLGAEHLFLYMGTNPANDNFTFVDDDALRPFSKPVHQRDAELVYLWEKFKRAPEGSTRKLEARKEVLDALSHRTHVDNSMKVIGKLLFGIEKGHEILKAVRPAGQPLVDDWGCLKAMVRTYETHCGSLAQYGMKHSRFLANVCNAGMKTEQMAEAAAQACVRVPSNPWSSVSQGFSA